MSTPPAPDPRRAAYVAAACGLFFDQGFGATSMNAVAARVGGSKTTLWACFPGKQALFEAVVDDLVGTYGRALAIDLSPGVALEDGLARMGLAILDTVLSPPILELHRLVIGEAARFPELGRALYERGPALGKARLAAFLADHMAAGRLADGDPMLAARQFAALCRGGLVEHRLLGLIDDPPAHVRAAEVDACVSRFLSGWAAR